MLITREQQNAWITNYVKQGHNYDERQGFIDGIEKTLEVVGEKLKTSTDDIKRQVLSEFIAEVKKEFADENWEYLDFIADRVLDK